MKKGHLDISDFTDWNFQMTLQLKQTYLSKSSGEIFKEAKY